MSAVRIRRLEADFQSLQRVTARHPRVRIVQTSGTPPDRYQLRFQVRSLQQKGEELVEVDHHLVEIHLPLNYPRVPPQCRMLTPVFHPNIAPHAICIGDHWSAGQSLPSIVSRIGEMLAFQSYNVKSPLNGEAARWVVEFEDRLPLDSAAMFLEDDGLPPAPPAPQQLLDVIPVEEEPITMTFACASCDTKLRVKVQQANRMARCPKCKHVQAIPSPT